MSDFSPRRALFLSLLLVLFATAASAAFPSARFDTRMVFDPSTRHTILFGGSTATDSFGSKLSYEFGDTWDWNGIVWTQLFPLHVPTARYGQVMVYDSARQRIVMWGGRTGNGKIDLNDTWVFKNGDWTQIDTPASPPGRVLAGGAYDPLRDRVVVFGGASISSDGKTVTPFHDTWELDGTTWKQVLPDGPVVDKPIMVWDSARANILMLAVDAKIVTHQYNYDPSVPAWKENTSTRLPSCVNEAALADQSNSGTVFFTGGFCSGVSGVEDNEEWDGNQWNPITVKVSVGRVYGQGMTFDAYRNETLLFGGNPVVGGLPRNEMWSYTGDWLPIVDPGLTPVARSLFVFESDPADNTIWLYGGVDPVTTYADFWKLRGGKWERVVVANPPPQSCSTPGGALDVDRKKLVIVCADSSLAEFDFVANDWKLITGLSKSPPARSYSSVVYDQNLKKTVVFGGYISDYINQTWLWDGASWTQQTHNLPPQRLSPAIWYDPHLKRTVIFGGLGRASSQDRVTRFNDMWSFDGSGWTQIKPSTLPPARYGAQVTVDPTTGNVLLFGGLRVDTVNTTGSDGKPTTTEVQVYADDFWQWDGTNWTQLTFPRVPFARENGGMAFDPSTQQFVVFGGYAGQQFFSDLWFLTPDKGWQPYVTSPIRRRATR